MPFEVQSNEDAGMRVPGVGLPQPETTPEGSLLAAAARQENWLVSSYKYLTERAGFEPDPDHNPIDMIKDTKYEAHYLQRFVDSRSEGDTIARMRRIDQEEDDERLLNSAGFPGLLARMAMGMVDPTVFIPIGGLIYKGAKTGQTVLHSAARMGAATAGFSAAQEAVLYGTQETRTFGDSTMHVASGAIVGALLGGAAGYLTARQLAKLSDDMDKFRGEVNRELLMLPPPRPAAAADASEGGIPPVGGFRAAGAGVERGPLTLEGALGAEKVAAPLSPVTRLQTSPFETSKAAIRDLGDAGLAYKENLEGVPTREGGTVETRVKMWRGPETTFFEALDDAYARYFFDKTESSFWERQSAGFRAGWASVTGSLGGKLTRDDFLTEVARAARRAEKHPIPHVAEAAKAFRELDESLKKAAIDAKIPGFSEEMKVLGAKSHVYRLYNREKIIAERPEFARILRENALKQRAAGLKEFEEKTAAKVSQLEQEAADLGLPLTERTALRESLKNDLAKLRDTNPEHVARDATLSSLRSRLAKARADKDGDVRKALQAEIKTVQAEGGEEFANYIKARLAITNRQRRLRSMDTVTPPTLKTQAESVRAGIENLKTAKGPDLAGMADEDIDELVTGIINNILGESTRRIPGFSIVRGPKGALAERVLNIADHKIEDWLENNIEKITRATVQTMAGDIEIARAFGNVTMVDTFARLLDEFNAKTAAAGGAKVRQQLSKQYKADVRDLEALRDRIRGSYAMPADPDGLLYRAGKVALGLNYIARLGGVSISQLPDLARPVMRYGMDAFSDGWVPLVRDLGTFKIAAREVRLAGTAVDLIRDQRAMELADLLDDFGRHTKFERGVQWAADKFSMLNLMSPMNAASKSLAGVTTMAHALRAAKGVATGTANKKQISILAQGGIDEDMAKRIWAQTEGTGDVVNGVHLPNTEKWTDLKAVEAFRALINREVETLIVSPGLERPLWGSLPLGRIILQFKTFALVSTQRTTLAGLQQRDAAVLAGVLSAMALGAVSAWSKAQLRGEDASLWTPGKWTVEALDNSGIMGILMEANGVTEKVTQGRIGLSMVSGRPVSRYASRNILGSALGPTADFMQDALTAGRLVGPTFDALTGRETPANQKFTATDVHALRKIMPLQNLFYIRWLFDKAEEGTVSAAGLPPRRTR